MEIVKLWVKVFNYLLPISALFFSWFSFFKKLVVYCMFMIKCVLVYLYDISVIEMETELENFF